MSMDKAVKGVLKEEGEVNNRLPFQLHTKDTVLHSVVP
tara:strand:- start:123 stop:236 length:114 start_codon:yes stop_codon:yes gene_type:complete